MNHRPRRDQGRGSSTYNDRRVGLASGQPAKTSRSGAGTRTSSSALRKISLAVEDRNGDVPWQRNKTTRSGPRARARLAAPTDKVATKLRGRGTVDTALHDTNSELLRDAASAIARRHGSLSLRQKLSCATPSRALASGAETMEVVVVGTHHRHMFAEWMLGSVGHDLVTHLLWPVAIVPPVEGSAASAA